MNAIDSPLVDNLEGVGNEEKEMLRRHGAAREEVLAHPVVVPLLFDKVEDQCSRFCKIPACGRLAFDEYLPCPCMTHPVSNAHGQSVSVFCCGKLMAKKAARSPKNCALRIWLAGFKSNEKALPFQSCRRETCGRRCG